jgi:hypothetical protein
MGWIKVLEAIMVQGLSQYAEKIDQNTTATISPQRAEVRGAQWPSIPV